MGIYQSFPINDKYYGFRIYNLKPNSPLIPCGVKELEDFLLLPEEVFELKIPFYEWIHRNNGKTILLKVYNLYQRHHKTIKLQIPIEGGIGATVRFENWSNASRNILHIVKLKENSWSQLNLNLKPMEDYIIAIRPNNKDISSLNQENKMPFDILDTVIKENLGEECEFYIYNIKQGARVTKAKIDNNPYFQLGCDAAYGSIHQFPQSKESEYNEEDNDDEDYLSEQSVDEKKNILVNNDNNDQYNV